MIINKHPTNDIRNKAINNDTNRLRKFSLRYEMYNDNYHDQVISKLGQIYRAFAQLKLDVQINDNNNIYKQVVNAISNVYSFGINREFEDESAQELYNDLRIDKTMDQANRYVNAFNDVLVQVSWDSNKEQPKIMLRLPHQTEVGYSQGEVEWVAYFVEMTGKDEKTERWAFWNDEEHYYIDKTSSGEKVVPIEDNEEMINPFGVLPFVFLHNGWRDESFWDKYTGDDLTGGTIDMAVHLTFLNHIIKTQSFKHLVGKGDNVGELLGQVLDPLSILTLTGQNTEISVLDLQSNYEQLHKVAQELASNLAIAYGVSPNQFRMTSQASSGFALQMENLKLDRFTLEQQADFKVYEQELFGMLKVVSEYYGQTIAGEMTVDFKEPNYPASQSEQLQVDQQAIDLGLTSPHKVLMRNNPDLTEEDARIDVDDNINARNDMLNKVKTGGSLTDTMSALGINNESKPTKEPEIKVKEDNKIFKYHIDSGLVTANEVREGIGLGKTRDGDKFVSTIGTLNKSKTVATPAKKDVIKDNAK